MYIGKKIEKNILNFLFMYNYHQCNNYSYSIKICKKLLNDSNYYLLEYINYLPEKLKILICNNNLITKLDDL